MSRAYRDGPAPVISGICRSIGLTRMVNGMVSWDDRQCKLSPGLRIEAIIINTLMNRWPLYRMERFFAGMDGQKIFGPGIIAGDLNDDALGRALDKLAVAGPREVYGTIALQVAMAEGVSMEVLHADTTSVSLQGAYEDNDKDDPLLITFGYSKDRRPDLKQFRYGLGVTRDNIPVIGEVLDGNGSDHDWNLELLLKLREKIPREAFKDLVYIADASLLSKENLEVMDKERIRFISRLPGTFLLESKLKERAWASGKWVQVGTFSKRRDASSYRVQCFQENLHGLRYRFVVVHSSKADKRKEKAVERRLEKTEKGLNDALKRLHAREFACEPDAHEAWREFLRQTRDECFCFAYQVEKVLRKKKRTHPGRPPRDTQPEFEEFYKAKAEICRNEAAIKDLKDKASCYVLLTNHFDADAWPGVAVLREYKSQIGVEQQFAFIKDPRVVGPVFLKSPERVNALAYVFLMALLVYSIIQRRARLALRDETEPMELAARGLSTFTPTGRRVLELFYDGLVIVADDGTRFIPTNLPLPERALAFLGLAKDVYLHWMPP